MKKPILLLFITAAFLTFFVTSTHAGDGIPDNCEYTSGAHYQPGIFPRYEAHTGRLVLVDWTSGEEVQMLSGGLADTRMLGWSPDCRYLATAVGTLASMDTVVWDVVENRRVGEVRDAQHKPHPVTWGPGGYLVVETRHGALLWHAPTNRQTPLTTSFNTTTGRNFSRLRWDAASSQLIVNLAVGGRAVYDLTTGAEVPEAVHATDSIPGSSSGEVVIGGKAYQCHNSYSYGYRNWFSGSGVPLVRPYYNVTDRLLALRLYNIYGADEVLATLEADMDAAWVRFHGWSASCRYVVGALGRPGEDASDTAVWDVVERRRIGTIPDARKILHPVYLSRTMDSVLVETRNGAYLWHLSTNNQILLTEDVEIPVVGHSAIRNFRRVRWDNETGYLLTLPLNGNGETVVAYDGRTGQQMPFEGPFIPPYVPLQRSIAQTPLPANPLEGTSGTTISNRYWFYYSYYSTYLPQTCPRYQLRFDRTTGQTSVVDRDTQAIVSVLQGRGTSVGFSPDCATVSGRMSLLPPAEIAYDNMPLDDVSQDELSSIVVFWDATTGRRLREFPNPYNYGGYSTVYWSPDGDRAVIRTTNGYFTYHPVSDHAALLVFNHEGGSLYTHPNVYWDYERGQVLLNGWGEVYAFDIVTGMQRYRFTANPRGGCSYWTCGFSVSPDNQTLFVYEDSSLGAWDLDTLEYSQVDIDPWRSAGRGAKAISPDGRYLVIAYQMIRVWDLHHLAEDFQERDPIHRHHGPAARVRSVRFIDHVIIETESAEGVQRWNVETGQQVE